MGYNIFRHVAYNPDVMVNRGYRGARVEEGKWALRPSTQTWVQEHEAKYPHVDYDVSKIRILDFVSPKYWEQRAQVSDHPELYTRSGQSRE